MPNEKNAVFYWWKAANKQFYWHLQAPNGKIVCQSEGYKRKAGCLNGIRAAQVYAGLADILNKD